MGSITPDERAAVMAQSPLKGAYDETVDRESAYEILMGRAQAATGGSTASSAPSGPAPSRRTWGAGGAAPPEPTTQSQRRPTSYPMPETSKPAPAPRASNRQTIGEAAAKSAVRSVTSAIGGSIGRALVRGVLGSLLKR
jgi:hypothetical protein